LKIERAHAVIQRFVRTISSDNKKIAVMGRTGMKRRTFVAAAAVALARPALAQASRTLIFVPQGNLVSIDPVWTTATVTRNAAAMVFETLYGRNDALEPKPQMIKGALVEDDGKLWTLTLREGLAFHDGEKVLARDCVASINRAG
jgi:peptide/nickel transport system substrate-binding protein